MKWLFACFFITTSLFAKPLEMRIETPHAILMNAKTGAILYEKNAREEVFPASTTKVATLLYILKTIPEGLDRIVKSSPTALKMTTEQAKKASSFTEPAYWLEKDGTTAHLVVGEEMSVRDLLYGAMLNSGNDACNVLAEHVCGNIPTFMEKLNDMVVDMGCSKTRFMNPHGLYHPEHKTCAYEMAMITREALKYPLFREIVATEVYKRPKTNKRNESEFTNFNALIRPGSDHYYPKALGVKTGRTKLAKFNLIAAAKDGDRELIAVLHKSPDSHKRYHDAIQMFETAFQEKIAEKILYAYGDTTFSVALPKADKSLVAEVIRDVVYKYFPSEEEELKSELIWCPLALPIEKGTKVAEIRVTGGEDRLVLVEPLFAVHRVDKMLVYRIYDTIVRITQLYIAPLVIPILFLLLFFLALKRVIKRKKFVQGKVFGSSL